MTTPTWINPILYKDYKIWIGPGYTKWCEYQYCHKDYDGPEDNRMGFGETIDECKAEIDEKEE